jgi:glutamine---fructose-6-phosphate transaminase (isomerizing)
LIDIRADRGSAREATAESLEMLSLPDMASTVTPLVYAIPVQLIAMPWPIPGRRMTTAPKI